MRVLVIHHNDLDGRCSAAIVRYAKKDEGAEIDFLEMDYKDNFDVDAIKKQYYDEAFVVDFSLHFEKMRKLKEKVGKLVWIDHHAAAKDFIYQDLPGMRDFSEKGMAACELTWKYLFNIGMPFSVELIGDYDKWALRHEPQCFRFYEGMKLKDNSPQSRIWIELFERDGAALDIALEGKIAMIYRDSYCEEMCKAFGYETEISGHSAFACNISKFGSKGFGKRMREYDICISYSHDGAKYTVSLYTENDKIDVSQICKKLGGGGHKGAAGFVSFKLPFQKKEKKNDS